MMIGVRIVNLRTMLMTQLGERKVRAAPVCLFLDITNFFISELGVRSMLDVQMKDGDALRKQETTGTAVSSPIERDFGKDDNHYSVLERHKKRKKTDKDIDSVVALKSLGIL